MTYIPDCRTDENYNEKYLNKKDREFVTGFDWCQDQADCFFYNLDIYKREFDIDGEDINLITFLENHEKIRDELKECLEHWIEMKRDELITSMIDNMDDEEYESIKAAVDDAEREKEDGKETE